MPPRKRRLRTVRDAPDLGPRPTPGASAFHDPEKYSLDRESTLTGAGGAVMRDGTTQVD
jgi:hypothetical protein